MPDHQNPGAATKRAAASAESAAMGNSPPNSTSGIDNNWAVAKSAAPLNPPPATPANILHSSDLLMDRFRIIRFIARGGMGEVYEAEDIELKEHIALKVIRSDIMTNDRAMERFKREIFLSRKVSHPNVCRVFDLARHRREAGGGDLVFLTMELLPGTTLAERLRHCKRLQTKEAFLIVSQIAAGLSAAHQNGIVHRDLKCGNVMLVPWPGKQERVVVTDFGLARAFAATMERMSLTGSNDIVGTPAYMAPEQVEGSEITSAADIYALGVVMFEMVTGVLPFTGESAYAVATKRLTEAAPSPRSLVPQLNSDWEKAILKCLERDPAKRYRSADEVVRALEPGDKSMRARTRNRLVPLLSIATVVLLLILGTTQYLFWTFWNKQLEVQQSAVTVPIRPAAVVMGFSDLSPNSSRKWLATALTEMMANELAASSELRVLSAAETSELKLHLISNPSQPLTKEGWQRLHKDYGIKWAVVGSYTLAGSGPTSKLRVDARLHDAATGEIIITIPEVGSAENPRELVWGIGTRLRQELNLQALTENQALNVMAFMPSNPDAARYYAEGIAKLRGYDAPGALEYLQKAVALEPKKPFSHAALASAWAALGYDSRAREESKLAVQNKENLAREYQLMLDATHYEFTNDWGKAESAYKQLFETFPDEIDYGLRLAEAQSRGGKPGDARGTLAKLRKLPAPLGDDPRIDLEEAAAAEVQSDFKTVERSSMLAAEKGRRKGLRLLTAEARWRQCGALNNLGEPSKARTACEEARKLYSSAGNRIGLARSLTGLANSFWYEGDLTSSLAFYEQALDAATAVGSQRDISGALLNLGNIHSARGELKAAEKNYREALIVSRRIEDTPGTVLNLNNLGLIQANQGSFSAARASYEESRQLSTSIQDSGGAARAATNLADLMRQTGELISARELLAEAIATQKSLNLQSDLAYSQLALGHVEMTEGNLAAAQESIQKAVETFTVLQEASGIARGRTSLAAVLFEQGNISEAEQITRQTLSDFNQQQDPIDEAGCRDVLARALLAQRKAKEAESELRRALSLNVQDFSTRLELRITLARTQAALDHREVAVSELNAIIASAHHAGSLSDELDARLALLEVTGKERESVRKLAAEKNFRLLERKIAQP